MTKLPFLRLPKVAMLLAAILVACCGRPAAALIVVPPGSNDNTSAPTDDPGWLNVGDNGVYLGNRWVITAAHVGAQTTTFPGIPGSFAVVPESAVQLQNPSGFGLTTSTDLLMYRLTTDPGLPSLVIASSTPVQRGHDHVHWRWRRRHAIRNGDAMGRGLARSRQRNSQWLRIDDQSQTVGHEPG